MTTIYQILTIAGWAWAVVVAIVLVIKLRRGEGPREFDVAGREVAGSEVTGTDEK